MPDVSLVENNKELFESQMAYNILHVLSKTQEEMYSKEITEVLNRMGVETSNKSVSNYIKQLRDNNFLSRGKRTQAQYYRINESGLYENWRNYINFLLDRAFTSHEGQRMESSEVVDDILEELEGKEEEFAPEGEETIDKEGIEAVLDEALGEFEENIKQIKSDFNSLSEDNDKLEKFFLNYSYQVLTKTSFLNLHQLYIRIMFREILIARWREEQLHDDIDSILKTLSACQLDESTIVGSGHLAYLRVYEDESIKGQYQLF